MRKFIIGLAVLVALLIAADRAAAAVAETKISDRLAASYRLPAKPHVSIQGFPFLTQVLTGRYGQVDITAARVAVGRITLTRLQARLDGVHAALSQLLHGKMSTVTADRASGSVVIPYGQLAGWLPHGVTVSEAGRVLRVAGDVHVFGTRIPLSGTAVPSVTASGIKVTPQSFTLGSGISVPAGTLAGHLGVLVPLTNLPLHMRIDSVAVTAAGLRAGATARHVLFSGGA